MTIYNADLILQNTPFDSFLILKLTSELFIFLWGDNFQYGIDWSFYETQEIDGLKKYIIPVHILLIENQYKLFLGDEDDLPTYTNKVSSFAEKGFNYDECGSLIFEMLLSSLIT